ncbi:hypothetical protein TPELB_35650 [Terrisporobacter petrolearius]|uniref:Uncharacterized protein n=1 Tax=Terrisporobacter petrolearius TaxID=1460447 RepID=A0ABZ3FJ48_9FIRM
MVKKQDKKINLKRIVILLVILSITIILLFKFLPWFLTSYSKAIIKLSNKDMFLMQINIINLILYVISISTVSIVGYLTYKVSKRQTEIAKKQTEIAENQIIYEYRKNICSPATIILFQINNRLYSDIMSLLDKNKDVLEGYFAGVSAQEQINKLPKTINISQDINSYVPQIISFIHDESTLFSFIRIIEDMNKSGGTVNMSYIIKDDYLDYDNKILKETNVTVWMLILGHILSNDLDNLKQYIKENEYKLLLKIKELTDVNKTIQNYETIK